MQGYRLLILLALVATLVSACGGTSAADETKVEVTLTDFGVKSSLDTFEAGSEYTFTITNEGLVPHEFMFIAPVMAGMADMHGDAVHATALVEVDETDLPPGASYTLVYTFPESTVGTDLEIACHTPGHYEAGMRMPITVQ